MSVEIHYVEVVKFDGDEVVEKIGPMSEKKADRVASGIEINLDHENYFVRISEG